MGSFFGGSRAGSIGGSSLNNDVMNDPIHKFIFGNQPQLNATAGPYAGIAPSLAMAQRGYAVQNGQPGNAVNPGTSAQLQATFGTPGNSPYGSAQATPSSAYVNASRGAAAAPNGQGW